MTTAEPMAAGRRGPRARPARARRTHDPRRWLLAAAVAAWTAYFLVPAPAWAFAIVPIAAAAMLVLEAWPALAALLVLAASELVAFGAVDYGGVELLLATVAVLGHLGRVHRPLWFGAACVVAFAISTAQRLPAEWPSALLTGLLVYGTVWGFGRLVQRRATVATRAVRRAEAIAAIDLERIVDGAAGDERRRIAGGVIGPLHDSLAGIAALARAPGAPDARLAAIAEHSRSTIARLHAALAPLRAGEAPRSASAVPAAGEGAGAHDLGADTGLGLDERRRDPLGALLARRVSGVALRALGAFGATVAMLGATALLGGDPSRTAYLVPAVLLPIAIVLGRRLPLLAGALGLAALAAAALDAPHPPSPLLPSAIALGVLSWRLVVDLETVLPQRGRTGAAPDRAALLRRIGFGLTALGAHLLAWQHGRAGVAFIVLVLLVAVSCALGWAQRDRITQREEARAARHLALAAAARQDAQREERRRIGRELHDLVSHAVVGIGLQARAARLVGTAAARRDAVLAGIADVAEAAVVELARCLVREALTNAARHAPGAAVRVRVLGDGGAARVSVRNGPARSGSSPLIEGAGSGLRGLAERVADRGGELEAGPLDDGFELRARFPLVAPPASAPAASGAAPAASASASSEPAAPAAAVRAASAPAASALVAAAPADAAPAASPHRPGAVLAEGGAA
ncbi:MAG: hypothetical protein GXX90_03995 [Microbacteriaceae bacterium]|nr:hypothetical protein [Microbacteriaceae bacterium]